MQTILNLETEKTLLVDGPAKVHLISGRVSVLGRLVKAGEKIIVRRGKRIPFEALRNSKVELTLGDSASYTETEESPIPSSWRNVVDEILHKKDERTILVVGGVDSGKTSFCTYLANLALNAKNKVALVDGDLGQSDIGPPGTVSLSFIKEPIIDPFKLQSEDLIFIGVTSPSGKIDETMHAVETLKEEASRKDANFIIINTDGWVEGEDAVNYKIRLVKIVAPDFVVAIRSGDELTSILAKLEDVKVLPVDSPENVKKRNRETRKLLRESAYKKHLKGAKVRSFLLRWVEIEGDFEFNEQTFRPHEEKGILVALEDARGKVLGIGIIINVDYKKEMIKICTPVNGAVSKIRVGRIKLDREGKEIGLIPKKSNSSPKGITG